RQGRGLPPRATQQEASAWQTACGMEEEAVHASFSIGQAIAQKSEIGGEAGMGRNREVGLRIEGIVDGDTLPGAELAIGGHHRLTTAVGEDEIESRERGA